MLFKDICEFDKAQEHNGCRFPLYKDDLLPFMQNLTRW
jgi:hypothetical protein